MVKNVLSKGEYIPKNILPRSARVNTAKRTCTPNVPFCNSRRLRTPSTTLTLTINLYTILWTLSYTCGTGRIRTLFVIVRSYLATLPTAVIVAKVCFFTSELHAFPIPSLPDAGIRHAASTFNAPSASQRCTTQCGGVPSRKVCPARYDASVPGNKDARWGSNPRPTNRKLYQLSYVRLQNNLSLMPVHLLVEMVYLVNCHTYNG